MSDRELLELAAKAAGIVGEYEEVFCKRSQRALGSGITVEGINGFYWSPLEDDGDALRVAVQLGMMVISSEKYRASSASVGDISCTERHGCDKHEPTRLAIVRAAAEIGRAMP